MKSFTRNLIEQNFINEIDDCFKKLGDLILDTNEKIIQFITGFYDVDNFIDSLLSFKKYIIESRKEEDIDSYVKKIKELINGKKYNKNLEDDELYKALQELFLEPININIYNSIIDLIEKGLNTEDIYNWYKLEKNLKSIVTFDVSYIISKH